MEEIMQMDITYSLSQKEDPFAYMTFEFEDELSKRDAKDPNMQVAGEDGEVCKFFLKGTCMKGNECPYRHSRGERSVVCKHWLRGLCKKGDLCEFLHQYDLSKMPECYFYSKFGECSNPECMYLHINPEDKVKECPWYARGFCKHGPKCRHKHQPKVACENYLLGFCPDGPNCKYGHPKFELPKEDESKKLRTPVICHKCGSVGHKASACPQNKAKEIQPSNNVGNNANNSNPRPLETVTCFKCGQLGHYANKCPNRRVPPPPGGYSIPDLPDGTVPTFPPAALYDAQDPQQPQHWNNSVRGQMAQ